MTTPAVPARQVIEVEFQSARRYGNPALDVVLDVCFTQPNGAQRTVPAFWAGGEVWKVRYASASLGTHPYTTDCSDTDNPGLHRLQGTIQVVAYDGDNPCCAMARPPWRQTSGTSATKTAPLSSGWATPGGSVSHSA
ncbi:MAG: DUF5060 domain-containing protein [Burkholderiaceae bacterium]